MEGERKTGIDTAQQRQTSVMDLVIQLQKGGEKWWLLSEQKKKMWGQLLVLLKSKNCCSEQHSIRLYKLKWRGKNTQDRKPSTHND